MRLSRFEVIVFTIASVISLLIIFLPIAPACATIVPPCQPIYFQQRVPLEVGLILIAITFSIALSIISINRIRKEIKVFGGRGQLLLKTILSWIAAAAFTGLLILVFWNKNAAIYGLFLGPPLAILFSSYFLAKNRFLLFAVFSVTFLIDTLIFILLVVAIISSLTPISSIIVN